MAFKMFRYQNQMPRLDSKVSYRAPKSTIWPETKIKSNHLKHTQVQTQQTTQESSAVRSSKCNWCGHNDMGFLSTFHEFRAHSGCGLDRSVFSRNRKTFHRHCGGRSIIRILQTNVLHIPPRERALQERSNGC